MAEKIIRVDDIDGTEGAESYSFSWQGEAYTIDLADKNAEKLQKALAPFIEAARKVRSGGSSTNGRRGGTRGSSTGDIPTKSVREWAQAAGIKVPSRGRIPAEVLQQYKDAH